jgi:aryl-alcohol dehydrogenase-like predicted oxidoreductase
MKWLKESVMTRENLALVKQFEPIAKDLGCTLAQLAIAWCCRNPNVSTVITGATTPEQVKENMQAIEVVPKLDADITQRIDDVLKGKPQLQMD